jgi:hypothetical protein
MGRIFAVVGVLMMLAACGVGRWVAVRPPMKLLVVPGARDVEVVALGWGAWQIRYQAPGAPTTWYTDVAHQLEAQHWSSLDQVAYAPLTRTYSRVVSLGFCDLWEWAYLTFDPLSPHIARINVRRWLAIPWWPGQRFLNDFHLFR